MVNLNSILDALAGDNPAGVNLRYTPVYDEIKEARRADDPFDRGAWSREIKSSDWDKVAALCIQALSDKTKDLQIAAWLTEALTIQNGFSGFAVGLHILTVFLRDFWDHVYPEIEDGDLEYRIGPLEFLNETLPMTLGLVPLTDSHTTTGYGWLKWQESRDVGYEKDTLNQYGDVEESKKAKREEKIAEGKLPPEQFDAAVAASSKSFYAALEKELTDCRDQFKLLDEAVDAKFGNQSPRLSDVQKALDDCHVLITNFLKKKRELEPDAAAEETGPETSKAAGPLEAPLLQHDIGTETAPPPVPGSAGYISDTLPIASTTGSSDTRPPESRLWEEVLRDLQTSGMKGALAKLLNASLSAPSVREANRYRLLMARLCLRAGRADLARPIVEELHALIAELNLERWESPAWIAEVLDAYFQCLTAEGASDDDKQRAHTELFQRLCTKDITKALVYKF